MDSSASNTTIYLYDGVNSIEEIDNSGTALTRYTQSNDIDEPLSELRGSTGTYYQWDGVGSVTSLSSGAGALANTYGYDSVGNLTDSTGTITNPFRYTAREFDSETGIYFYRARYFDATTGRFVSGDPFGFNGGINLYRYVLNQPVNNTDPLGLTCTTRIMMVTAYCWTGNPTKSGVYPGPGTVAVANNKPQPHPMGSSVGVSGPLADPFFDPRPLDPFNTPSYTGRVQDTGAGWNAKHHHVQPDDWIDIFFPGAGCEKQALAWGVQWRKVTICTKDDCPNGKK